MAKCQQCAARKTSGMCKAPCRTLPRPLQAGDVVGVDLKTVTPPSGAKDKWDHVSLTRLYIWTCMGLGPRWWSVSWKQTYGTVTKPNFPTSEIHVYYLFESHARIVTHPILFLNMFTWRFGRLQELLHLFLLSAASSGKVSLKSRPCWYGGTRDWRATLRMVGQRQSVSQCGGGVSMPRAFNIDTVHSSCSPAVERVSGGDAWLSGWCGNSFLFPISVYVYIYIYIIYTYW